MPGTRPGMTTVSGERANHERQSVCTPLSRGGSAVHPVAARIVEPGLEPPRQFPRHGRHGDRGRHHARKSPAGRWPRLAAGDPRHRDRRLRRRRDRAPCADDVDARTRRRLPLAGRHGRGAGRAGAFYAPEAFDIGTPGNIHPQSLVEMSLGVAIGALTFTGSVIAFLKLSARMSGAPIILPARHVINIVLALALVFFIVGLVLSGSVLDFWLITIIALVLGVLMIIPIGGADMPVVISMLNSYSGWAAAGIGFTLGNSALIITGALVGSSGAILSYIMCRGMNRSFISVILGGFGGEVAVAGAGTEHRPVKQGSAEDAAFIL